MDFRDVSVATLMLGWALTLGCGKGREVEPNDHFTQATPVGGKSELSGTMSSAADVDIYRLESTRADQVLSIRVGGIREMDFVLTVQDKDRRELKRYDETSAGGDERALDFGIGSGALYLVLANKNASAANPDQPYTLSFEFAPARESEAEPNDRALQANSLVPGGVTRGHYFPSRNLLTEETGFLEEDWFRVDVAREGMFLLNVDVSEVPKVDPVLEVYGPNSYKIKTIDAGGAGEPEVLRGFGIRGPVHYYLRLRGKSSSEWNAEIPYEMLTELIPYRGEDEFEPNDQRLEATPFEGEKMLGRIDSPGDVDWYKITLPDDAKSLLAADLKGAMGLDLKLSLADDIGRVIVEADDQGVEGTEVLTGLGVGKGEYYAVVSEKTRKASNPRHSYTLSKSLAGFERGLEFELNDSSAAAQSLDVGGSVNGYLAPAGDVDWYVFNAFSSMDVAFDVTGVLNVSLASSLYDGDGKVVMETAGARPGDPISTTRRIEPGSYTFRLKAAVAGQNNSRDKYTLRIHSR